MTVSVGDEAYRQARIRAAEQGTSVSALVAGFLETLSADSDAEFARLRRQQREATAQVTAFSAGDRLGRDEVHDRAALR